MIPPTPMQYNIFFSHFLYPLSLQIQFNIAFFSDTLFKILMSYKVYNMYDFFLCNFY